MANEFDDFSNVPKPTLIFGGTPEPTPADAAAEAARKALEAAAGLSTAAPSSGDNLPGEPIVPVATEEERKAAAAAAAAITPPASPAASAAAVALDFGAGQAAAAPAQAPSPLDAVDDSILTEAEKAQVEAFSHQIDLSDSSAVLQYGAGAQKKMADFSEKALASVRTKDLGEVGNMITGLVAELRSFDTEEERGGFLGLFRKPVDKLASMKMKYDKVETNVDKICQVLEDHQVQLLKDIAMLDSMYELNLAYFKELTMYIIAGKKRLKEVREGELARLIERAQQTGLAEDAQAARDLDEKCERFEKKLYDLELTRTVALQTAPQIRLVQDSDEIMVEKIQSTLVNTIPLWKNQMLIALGIQHSTEAARAQQEVAELTNQLLKKNAEKLKTATVETAKAAERGIVDIETLKHTNETLISTLDEVIRIQDEGRSRRQAAEAEMRQMEEDLKKKLLTMSSN